MQNNIHSRLGAIGLFALFVLILSFSRGLVPLLSGNASLANITYKISTGIGMLLGSYGIIVALTKKIDVIRPTLRKLLLLNLFLYIIWLIPVTLVEPRVNLLMVFVYSAILPFSIYGLMRIPNHLVLAAFRWGTFLVAITVLWDFIDINLPFGSGVEVAMQRQTLLRPDSFEGFGRTANILRPVGLFGSRPHDSANFLAILAIFWLSITITKQKGRFVNTIFTFMAFLGLMVTQSASNILAFFAGVVVLLFLSVTTIRLKHLFYGMLTLLILGLGLYRYIGAYIDNPMDVLFHWTLRAGKGGAWKAMTDIGTFDKFGDYMIFVTGHSASLKISEISNITEIAFMKILVELGVIHFTVFMLLLLYPLLRYKRAGKAEKKRIIPYVLAVSVGVISLWHYGSVLRATIIFTFFAMYTQVLVLTSSCDSHFKKKKHVDNDHANMGLMKT